MPAVQTGRGACPCSGAWRADAPDGNRPEIADLAADAPKPRVVMLLVLDGMRRDYFDRYAESMPTLLHRLARAQCLVHAGTAEHRSVQHRCRAFDPLDGNRSWGARCHRQQRLRCRQPPALRVLCRCHTARPDGIDAGRRVAVCDVWARSHLGAGQYDRAATALAGHGACQLNGQPVVMASYDQKTGSWTTNSNCFGCPHT